MNTQLSHTAQRDPGVPMRPLVDLKPIVVLSVCMALQMTSYVMIVPLFARRFSQFGASVQALAISEMGYALAATIAAPFMGALADRLGRRRLVLGSLAAYVLAFSGYLFAPTAFALIAIRALTGALTAGLIPAATGMVADLAPADRRAQWIGFLNGGASVGWILGPVLGGALYDKWGYSVALTASTLTAAVTLLLAILMLPEGRAVFRFPSQGPRLAPRHFAVALGPFPDPALNHICNYVRMGLDRAAVHVLCLRRPPLELLHAGRRHEYLWNRHDARRIWSQPAE
jgi:MFS family permease